MEIIIAENSGLCYGVKRALNIARRTRRRRGRTGRDAGRPHPQSPGHRRPRAAGHPLRRLAGGHPRAGRSSSAATGSRPRSAARLVRKKARGRGRDLPHRHGDPEARRRPWPGRTGRSSSSANREHPEIRGLLGYSRGRVVIVENEAQARALPCRKKRAVLAQSTQDVDLFGRVVAGPGRDGPASSRVHNTICRSTQTRQQATAELAARVDVLFIVGGRDELQHRASSTEISRRILPRTYLRRERRPRSGRGCSAERRP